MFSQLSPDPECQDLPASQRLKNALEQSGLGHYSVRVGKMIGRKSRAATETHSQTLLDLLEIVEEQVSQNVERRYVEARREAAYSL